MSASGVGFWRDQKVFLVGMGILYASVVPFLLALERYPHNDVRLYFETTQALFSGEWPYRDRTFEYPPFALLWYVLPTLAGSLRGFQFWFAIEILLIDLALKVYLLAQGVKRSPGWNGLIPLVAYSFGVAFLHHFYLQRMDLIPIALSLVAVVLFAQHRYFGSGAVLALAAGTKLFPILFSLPLAIMAWRHGKAGRFLWGHAALLFPLALLSFFLPWWRFLSFHDARGLEVESLYASVLWFMGFFVDLDLEWAWVSAWQEVTGRSAMAVVPYAKGLMAGTVGGTVLFATYRVWRSRMIYDTATLSGLLLFVLLPFVALNIVLSPQYMIWLLVLAAVALLPVAGGTNAAPGLAPGSKTVAWAFGSISLMTAVTPVWYPTPEFGSGLRLDQTAVLLARNLGLIGVWIALGWLLWRGWVGSTGHGFQGESTEGKSPFEPSRKDDWERRSR